MDAWAVLLDERPHDLLLVRDFDEFGSAVADRVAADHGVAVGQPLRAAGIVQQRLVKVGVGEFPHDRALGVELNHHVAVGAVDQRVSVVKANRGERPRVLRFFGRLRLPHDVAIGRVLADDLVEQLRYEIVPVGQHARHARFHVVVGGLRLDRRLVHDRALGVDLEDARLVAGLGDHSVAVGHSLRGVDFALRAGEFPHDLSVGRHFDRCAMRALVALGEGDQDVAVGEHLSVARTLGKRPRGFSIGLDDARLSAESEETVGDRVRAQRARRHARGDARRHHGECRKERAA